MVKTHSPNKFFKITAAKIILLSFLALILIGAFLLCLPISNTSGTWTSFIDSLFTSTSSVCLTGLSVYDIGINLTRFGQVVLLFLIQIGGLGFISIASLIFLLIGKKIDYASRLTIQESLNKEDSKGVVKTLIIVLISTITIEFVGFLLLLGPMIDFAGSFGTGLFNAFFLSVSAFCNAGFDSLGTLTPEFSNLACFANNPFVLIPIMLLIVTGGIGFIVFIDLFSKRKSKKKLNLHTSIVLIATAIFICGGAALILIFEWNNANTIGNFSFGGKLMNSFFQSITTRTAGFATFNQGDMNPVSIVLCEILMFIGGSPASMAGGVKTTTFFVLMLFLFKSPNQNGDVIYKTRKITHSLIYKAFKIVIIAMLILFVGLISIFLIEGNKFSLVSLSYECMSAICTVGLSFGITPLLSVPSKLILSLMMYIGRIGMLTIPMIFKTKNQPVGIEYMEAKITVG